MQATELSKTHDIFAKSALRNNGFVVSPVPKGSNFQRLTYRSFTF